MIMGNAQGVSLLLDGARGGEAGVAAVSGALEAGALLASDALELAHKAEAELQVTRKYLEEAHATIRALTADRDMSTWVVMDPPLGHGWTTVTDGGTEPELRGRLICTTCTSPTILRTGGPGGESIVWSAGPVVTAAQCHDVNGAKR